MDGARSDPAESPVAASSADQDRCPRGGDTNVAAGNDTARASVAHRRSDSSEPEPQFSGSTANCASGRKDLSGGAGGGAQSSDDGATDGDDDAAGQVGSARSSTGGADRGGQNPESTSTDSDSTDSESTDSDSSNSEHEQSGKSGGEDSSESDGEESGGDESEDEPSSDGVSDDQATDRSDKGSEDDEAVQTRDETGADPTRRPGRLRYPADLINTDWWYLTLPTGEPGSPHTVEGEQLKTFSNDFFRLTPDRKGVVFAANAGGVTTENSNYPRSELREMNGSKKAAWSNTSGRHILDVCEAVTKVGGSSAPQRGLHGEERSERNGHDRGPTAGDRPSLLVSSIGRVLEPHRGHGMVLGTHRSYPTAQDNRPHQPS